MKVLVQNQEIQLKRVVTNFPELAENWTKEIAAMQCGRNNGDGSQAPSACIVALLIGNVCTSLSQD